MGKRFVWWLAASALVGALSPSAGQAETAVFTAALQPANEVPPVTNADRIGVVLAIVTLDITRDGGSNITAATVRFEIGLARFPTTGQVILAHIHQGPPGLNGPVRIDSGIQPASSVSLSGGDTVITRPNVNVTVGNLVSVAGLLADPSAFYVNVHTALSPGGAARGQLEATPSLGFAVFPDALTYAPGAPIRIKLFLGNALTPGAADVLAGVALPADQSAALCGPGDTALFFIGRTGGITEACASRLGGPSSPAIFLAENVTIPVVPLTIFTLLGGQVPAGALSGTYRAFIGLAAPDTFPNGPIQQDIQTFTIGP
jgi:hypothetical protein